MNPRIRKIGIVTMLLIFVGVNLPANAQTSPGAAPSPSPGSGGPQSQVSPTPATPPDAVVIAIGDLKVTAREVDRILQTMPGQYRPFYSGAGKRQLADIIVNNKLLFKEAERRQMQDKDPTNIDIKISREAILTFVARNELEKEVQITEEGLQKYLDDNMARFEEAKVRRIVIYSAAGLNVNPNQPTGSCLAPEEARAKAEDIRKKLTDGADFEEMAAKFSSDSLTSGKGGDLGYIRRGHQMPMIVPPVEQAIFSIPVGSLSEVIPSAFGFEIVKVEDRRKPKLQQLRKELEPQYRKQKVEDLVKEMRAQQTVTIDENFFTPKQANSTSPNKK